MVHAVTSRFAARSYELDSYRHLNNGVYLGWFEQARLEYLQSLGFSYDGFADRRQWLVVARTEVDFRAPVRLGDAAQVDTRVVAIGRSSLRFRQRMSLVARPAAGAGAAGAAAGSAGAAAGEIRLAAEALTVMVFSGPEGSSVPVPDDVRAAIGPV